MKRLLMILAVLSLASAANAQLILTGVCDGPLPGGVPKFIELYACDDIPDMSVYGVGSANNGGGTDGVEFTFPADFVAAGTAIYVEYISVTTPTAFVDYMGFPATYDGGSQAANINGDDAIELFLLTGPEPVVIDIHGDINVDGTGTPWDSLDGWAKRATMTGPDGSTFVLENWIFSGINATDGCLTNGTCGSVYPVGGFACDAAIPTENVNFGAIKAMYR